MATALLGVGLGAALMYGMNSGGHGDENNDNSIHNDNRGAGCVGDNCTNNNITGDHFYGDQRSVQDMTNILISKAIVDVGMRNASRCKASASVTQEMNVSIKNCHAARDLNAGQQMRVVYDFQCVMKSIQNTNQMSKFVNDVRARLNQQLSDSSGQSDPMTATVQRTLQKIVNETVTKAMIENVFESVTSMNKSQVMNMNYEGCSAGRDINLKQTIQFNMRSAVTTATKASFTQQASSMSRLSTVLKQKNTRTEKSSTQMIVIGAIVVLVVLIIGMVVYKLNKKPSPQMNLQMPVAAAQPVAVAQPVAAQDLTKVFPSRARLYPLNCQICPPILLH